MRIQRKSKYKKHETMILTYSNVAYKNIGGQARKNNTSKRTKINNWNTNGNTLKQSAKGSKYKEGSKKY